MSISRIRYIKIDLFHDEELADIPVHVRYFFAGLWTLSDKSGRGEDRPIKIKALLFPYDDFNGDELMAMLHPKFVLRYTAEDGRNYYQIRAWEKHQRPHTSERDSVIPPPKDIDLPLNAVKQQQTNVRQRQNKSYKGMGMGMGMGTGMGCGGKQVRARKAQDDDLFNIFWDAYPRRVAKTSAIRAWRKTTISQEIIAKMLDALRIQSESPQWREDGGRYIPHPATWLNGKRWEDSLGPKPALGSNVSQVRMSGPFPGHPDGVPLLHGETTDGAEHRIRRQKTQEFARKRQADEQATAAANSAKGINQSGARTNPAPSTETTSANGGS